MFCCRKANLDVVDTSVKINIPIEIDIIDKGKNSLEEEKKIDFEISSENIIVINDDKIILSTRPSQIEISSKKLSLSENE